MSTFYSLTNQIRLASLLGFILASTLLSACPQNSDSTTSSDAGQTTASADLNSSPAASADSTASSAPVADEGKGIGPVTTVEVGALDPALAAEGKKTFEAKCTSCHKIEAKYVGPALQDVTKRRKPEWIMNMILNPAEMTQKDPTAKELFGKFLIQMANQNLDQKQARSVLEYFRSNDSK